jgi:predicted phosphohydrolase
MPLRHFHIPTPGWDDDLDHHDEVVRDVAAEVALRGPLDAVLIGGDIAFSARPEEYEKALAWIDEILRAGGGLDRSKVWTVPGNHDVSWDVVNSSGDAARFRHAMATCDVSAIDYEFQQRLAGDPAADGLLLPLAEYNRFAEQFLCTTSRDSLAWQDTSLSVDGWTVRLTGLNSAINSGPADDEGKLVVGTQQCRIPRSSGTIHLAMLHHPPRWIRDWEVVQPYLNRAHVVLFGHEHSFEARQDVSFGTVSLSAGAVSPERDAHGEVEPFVPAFNFITLARVDDRLAVGIMPRYWSKIATRFVEHPAGVRSYLVDQDPALGVDEIAEEMSALHENSDNTSTASPLIAVPDAADEPEGDAATRTSLRAIGVRYQSLPVFRRLDIARALDVVTDEDMQRPSVELYPLLLSRIRDRDLVEGLIREMNK